MKKFGYLLVLVILVGAGCTNTEIAPVDFPGYEIVVDADMTENQDSDLSHEEGGNNSTLDEDDITSVDSPENNDTPANEYAPAPAAITHALPTNTIVSTAYGITLAVTRDGYLYAWGGSWVLGGVGDGTTYTRNSPVRIMDNVAYAHATSDLYLVITTDGSLYTWGINFESTSMVGASLVPTRVLENVVYATMSPCMINSHVWHGVRVYAITTDGKLWAWGAGGEMGNALGTGTPENEPVPVVILENVASVKSTSNGDYAITNDGVLWTWHGGRWLAEIGEWLEAQLYPVQIASDLANLCVHAYFATRDIANVRVLHPLLDAAGIRQVKLDRNANFVVAYDNTLWGWGRNMIHDHWSEGPLLGDGTTITRYDPVEIMQNVEEVYFHGNAAYAITTNGELWAWGVNDTSGILGDGTVLDWQTLPDGAINMEYIGMGVGIAWLLPDGAGTNIRLRPVKIMDDVVYVTSAYMFDHGWLRGFRTFAVTSCGGVWAWGVNSWIDGEYAHLGDGTYEDRLYPVRVL